MTGEEIQQALESAYEKWRGKLQRADFELQRFCPPWLVHTTERYCNAKHRILIIGQEDYGWYWSKDSYPGWRFADENTLEDFVRNEDSVEALCSGYKDFNFAEGTPSARSAYWQAFREVQGWPDTGALTSNLVRASCHAESISVQDQATRDSFLSVQKPLLVEEIGILKPHACLFFTGPNYDYILDRTFDGIERIAVGAAPIRELARLRHPKLPELSFRTYHPAYLSQGKKWHFIDEIRASLGV